MALGWGPLPGRLSPALGLQPCNPGVGPTPGQPGWLSLCPCQGQQDHSSFGAKDPAQL